MMIELVCPCCLLHFSAPSAARSTEILDRMTEDGPWVALGEGDTFEEMIVMALNTRGAIRCPDCREVLTINEENLRCPGQEMLVCS